MTMTEPVAHAVIETQLACDMHDGWNQVPGVEVQGTSISIDPAEYFFRFEAPQWRLCRWEPVQQHLLPVAETGTVTVEQQALEFIREHSFLTTDPAQVLRTAEQVYGHVFRVERLADPDLVSMGVTTWHLRILREMGTMMALNRVDLDGHLSNVGPAWFFGQLAEVVFGLSNAEAMLVDELYHGTFFNEARRTECVKAHAALGGRLVHGCSGSPNMAGGCVVTYGTSIDAFHRELQTLKRGWLSEIDGYRQQAD